MINKFSLFVCFVLIYNSGCSQKQEVANTVIEAEFNIDTSLLHPVSLIDSTLDLSIKIPRNWIEMDKAFENTIKTNLLINDYNNSLLKFGYINRLDSSIMVLLDVTNIADSVYANLKKDYNELLNINNIWSDIQFQEFIYNQFRIEQYVLQNEQILYFKLVCFRIEDQPEINTKFELLYILNRKYLSDNIQSVESSIGSINQL